MSSIQLCSIMNSHSVVLLAYHSVVVSVRISYVYACSSICSVPLDILLSFGRLSPTLTQAPLFQRSVSPCFQWQTIGQNLMCMPDNARKWCALISFHINRRRIARKVPFPSASSLSFSNNRFDRISLSRDTASILRLTSLAPIPSYAYSIARPHSFACAPPTSLSSSPAICQKNQPTRSRSTLAYTISSGIKIPTRITLVSPDGCMEGADGIGNIRFSKVIFICAVKERACLHNFLTMRYFILLNSVQF
jgi:hypothetical protein